MCGTIECSYFNVFLSYLCLFVQVRFFINNDRFFKGAVIAVSSEKFRTFEKILEHLTRIMCNQVTLPNGVRYVVCSNKTTKEWKTNGESIVISIGFFLQIYFRDGRETRGGGVRVVTRGQLPLLQQRELQEAGLPQAQPGAGSAPVEQDQEGDILLR